MKCDTEFAQVVNCCLNVSKIVMHANMFAMSK